MFPSSGQFRHLPCPDFSSAEVSCHRPYCHFNHIRKDEKAAEVKKPVVPEYKATPQLLTLQLHPPSLHENKKRKNIEYEPEKPGINDSPQKKNRKVSADAPLYIPSSTNSTFNIDCLDLDDCAAEFEELNSLIESEINKEPAEEDEEIEDVPYFNGNQHNEETENISNHVQDIEVDIEVEKEPKGKTERTEKVGKLERHASTSSLNSKQKHKSSHRDRKEKTREKENKEEQSKEKERHKPKGDENGEKHSSTSDKKKKHASTSHASSSQKSSSHKSHSSSKESKHSSKAITSKETDKHDDKKKHQNPSSSSSNSKSSSKHRREHHSPSSSSRSKTQKSSTSTSSSSKTKSKEHKNSVDSQQDSSPEAFAYDNEALESLITTEEDIQKQCEMIYDQIEQEIATTKEAPDNPKPELVALPEEEDDLALPQKKRVAHENADQVIRTPKVAAPNPIRNAMQAMYARQERLREQKKAEAEAAERALKEAEERVRKAKEALTEEHSNLTPLIPKSFLTPPTRPLVRSIAPVSNLVALARAKQKVDELKAKKTQQTFPYLAQKGKPRVSHKPTNLEAEEKAEKPKPPVLEACSSKISFNIRMQYYEMMVKQCKAIYPAIEDAWERAQTEELAVMVKCNTPVVYKSSAMLAISKLRKEALAAGNKPATNKIISHEVVLAGKLANKTDWSVVKKTKSSTAPASSEPFDALPTEKAYKMARDLCLTEEQLSANGFPRAGARLGTAIINDPRAQQNGWRTSVHGMNRICRRCGKQFSLESYDEVRVDECNFHPKSAGYRRGYTDNIHHCCQAPVGVPGCCYANYHVTDSVDPDNLTGFVTTMDKGEDYVPKTSDIYALDCEMCYTTKGIELTRITVVDVYGKIKYDTFVKPDNKIIDYNTTFSGITEESLSKNTRSLREVQAVLLSIFHSQTILVGHSLDSDMKALKMIHSCVVDTSVLFPHKMGPPKKRALKTLCTEHLKRIIQESEGGHDSAEDAEVCIALLKFYLRNKIKA